MTLMSSVHTPADLLNPPDDKLYELIDGELVEKKVSTLSIWTATRLSFLINLYLESNPSGYVFVEQPLICFPDRPNHGRRPDVCYVSKSRLPGSLGDGDLEVAPELVVEIVSTHDNAGSLEMKVQEYLHAGVRVVWTIYPVQQVVRVHHADGTERLLQRTDAISGEDFLPGFTCPVADIFPKT